MPPAILTDIRLALPSFLFALSITAEVVVQCGLQSFIFLYEKRADFLNAAFLVSTLQALYAQGTPYQGNKGTRRSSARDVIFPGFQVVP
jgi:hypothetical protein